MNDLNQSDIETICKQLLDEFRGILSWKWDDLIGTILAEFSADKEEDVRAILPPGRYRELINESCLRYYDRRAL